MTIWKFIEYKSISLGEAILIGLTIAVPLVGALIQYFRHRTLALSLLLSDSSVPRGHTKLLHVTVKARIAGTLQRFNVRFVEKQWLGISTRDAPKDVVEIVNLN